MYILERKALNDTNPQEDMLRHTSLANIIGQRVHIVAHKTWETHSGVTSTVILPNNISTPTW